MLILQVVSDCSSLVLFNSLVKVSARVADITCITQVTLKMINNALLIHKGWLVFPHFDFVLDLSTCVHRADSCIHLPTEVCKLSEESQTQQQVPDNNKAPIRIVLPFKDQKSADAVRRQLIGF